MPTTSAPRRLKFTLCNLQLGIGTTRGYWQYLTTGWKYYFPHDSRALPDAARFIREQKPDLVALCEVERASRRSRGLNQPARLAELSGMPYHLFWPTLDALPARYQGNALLSRWEVTDVANHRLPGAGEPRYLSEARLTLSGIDVRVLVTHLSLESRARERQIAATAHIVGTCKTPTLLAGDFNISCEQELDVLLGSGLVKTFGGATFPSWKPVRLLDQIFVSEHFTNVAQYAFRDFRFSDHLPLVAELSLQPCQA